VCEVCPQAYQLASTCSAMAHVSHWWPQRSHRVFWFWPVPDLGNIICWFSLPRAIQNHVGWYTGGSQVNPMTIIFIYIYIHIRFFFPTASNSSASWSLFSKLDESASGVPQNTLCSMVMFFMRVGNLGCPPFWRDVLKLGAGSAYHIIAFDRIWSQKIYA